MTRPPGHAEKLKRDCLSYSYSQQPALCLGCVDTGVAKDNMLAPTAFAGSLHVRQAQVPLIPVSPAPRTTDGEGRRVRVIVVETGAVGRCPPQGRARLDRCGLFAAEVAEGLAGATFL